MQIMKRLLFSILMAGFVYAGQSQEINDWENPLVIGINKEPYHANLTYHRKSIIVANVNRWMVAGNSVGMHVLSRE